MEIKEIQKPSLLSRTSPSLMKRATSLSFSYRKNTSQNVSNNQELVRNNLLFRCEGQLGIGDVNRFIINHYDLPSVDQIELQSDDYGKYLWLRVKNDEINMLRPFYLTGPFTFYIDVTPYNYKKSQKFNEKIQFNPDIKPGQSFKAKLYINENSRVKEGHYSWTIDMLSQITLATKFVVSYSFRIGYDKKLLKAIGPDEFKETEKLLCQKLTTRELWSTPPRYAEKPVHLVIMTHGIFSNIGCDMFFLKDELEKAVSRNPDANIIVRGYDGNAGKPEKGIRYLGKRVGEYILNFYDNSPYNIDRISFIGHSLGGPVETYAILHILYVRSDFFQKVTPLNLIFLASPMLGILPEFPKYLSFALDIGILGATGRDLTLHHKFPKLVKKSNEKTTKEYKSFTSKPILEQILLGSSHEIYERFLNRTIYANAVNDGIVPLRTSALLYLDWKSLDQIEILKEKETQIENFTIPNELEKESVTRPRRSTAGEVPLGDSDIKRTEKKVKEEKAIKNAHKAALKNLEANNKSELMHCTNFIQDLKKNRKRNKIKKYLATQTSSKEKDRNFIGDTSSTITDQSKNTPDVTRNGDNDSILDVHIPPAASIILSAANVMAAPSPSPNYLTNPEVRSKTIFHDKYYTFKDLPEPLYSKNGGQHSRTNTKMCHFISGNKKAIQEKMARSWHWHMEWRKVLVTLRPDAHNNIIVRRRYVNAWGWEVINHLVENHFGEVAIRKENEFIQSVKAQKFMKEDNSK